MTGKAAQTQGPLAEAKPECFPHGGQGAPSVVQGARVQVLCVTSDLSDQFEDGGTFALLFAIR